MTEKRNAPVRILHWGMLGGRGGIEMFIMNLYRQIDRSLVQFDFLDGHNHRQPFEEEINDLGGRVFHVLYTQKEAPFSAKRRLRRFYSEHNEIGGVHVHANFPFAMPLEEAFKAGIDLRILHSHNSQGSALPNDSLKKVVAKTREYVVSRQIERYPSHYFACSDTAAEFMFPGKPYQWIRNGIDTAQYNYNTAIRKEVRAELGIAPETVVVGFCGRLRNQKNPLFAIEVFSHYHRMNPQSIFVILGNGELESAMRRRVAECRLEESVLFLGGERSDVNRIYQSMDMLLMPSLYEGLPLVLIEAQTAGLPCLVSSEAVGEQAKITDLVQFRSLSHSVQAWASDIEAMVGHRAERTGCMSQVQEAGFDIKATATMLQRFYCEHAGRR